MSVDVSSNRPEPSHQVNDLAAQIAAAVDMRLVGDDVRTAPNVPIPGYRRLFGGQMLAQAITVAESSSDKRVRTMHVSFLAEGKPTEGALEWTTEAPRDGRSFDFRCLAACQGARPIALATVTLYGGGRGIEHADRPPLVAGPDDLDTYSGLRTMPVDMRVVDGVDLRDPSVGPPDLVVWMRLRGSPTRERVDLSRQYLAYCSDGTMMAAAMRPHDGIAMGAPSTGATAITSHSMTFHQPFRFDGWALFVQHAPVAANGVATIRGDWFVDDVLVASCAQDVVIRLAE